MRAHQEEKQLNQRELQEKPEKIHLAARIRPETTKAPSAKRARCLILLVLGHRIELWTHGFSDRCSLVCLTLYLSILTKTPASQVKILPEYYNSRSNYT